MRFAIALFALTFVAQTLVPAFAQSATDEVASVPLMEGASVNVLGGECAAQPKLQLSDQQKEKFYEMKNKLLCDIGPKKVALAEQKRLLKDLITKDTLDRKAIEATQEKINALRSDLANVTVAFRMDMQQELTPEQRKVIRYRGLKPGKGHHGKRHGKRFPQANQESEKTIGTEPLPAEEFTPANI